MKILPVCVRFQCEQNLLRTKLSKRTQLNIENSRQFFNLKLPEHKFFGNFLAALSGMLFLKVPSQTTDK